MTINYSNYSLDELNEALNSIDSIAYPDNYQRLLREIELRKQHISAAAEAKELQPVEEVKDSCIADYWNPKTAKETQRSVINTLALAKLAILIFVLCLPAFLNSYLINVSVYATLKVIALFIAATTFVGSTVYLSKKSASSSTSKENSEENNTIKVILLSCVWGLSSYFISLKTIPTVLHIYVLDNNEAAKLVTVADKNHRYRKKYCNGKVYLKEYENVGLDYICSVLSRDTWESLKKDDAIKIYGSESTLGFLVKQAKKVKR